MSATNGREKINIAGNLPFWVNPIKKDRGCPPVEWKEKPLDYETTKTALLLESAEYNISHSLLEPPWLVTGWNSQGNLFKPKQNIRNYRKCKYLRYRHFAQKRPWHGIYCQTLQHVMGVDFNLDISYPVNHLSRIKIFDTTFNGCPICSSWYQEVFQNA